jgi:DNA-binding transcriptional ArsR family regulator
MGALSQLIDSFLQQGKYHFTTEEVSSALGLEGSAVRQSLRRLRRKRRIASPQRGFHVVVPPEYRALGCLPPEQFVPQLLDQSGEPYHVTLLSAAQLHGAAHQRPQRFQVMVAKPRRTITCGAVNVDFFVLGDIESVSTTVMNTPRGLLQVASPEATAIELVGYQKHAGASTTLPRFCPNSPRPCRRRCLQQRRPGFRWLGHRGSGICSTWWSNTLSPVHCWNTSRKEPGASRPSRRRCRGRARPGPRNGSLRSTPRWSPTCDPEGRGFGECPLLSDGGVGFQPAQGRSPSGWRHHSGQDAHCTMGSDGNEKKSVPWHSVTIAVLAKSCKSANENRVPR